MALHAFMWRRTLALTSLAGIIISFLANTSHDPELCGETKEISVLALGGSAGRWATLLHPSLSVQKQVSVMWEGRKMLLFWLQSPKFSES